MTHQSTLHEIAEKLRRRADGDLTAAEDCWSDDMVVWHSFDDREQHITGHLRGAHSRAKLEAFHRAMPNFRRIVTVYVSESTDTLIEITTWTGHFEQADAAVAVDGMTIGNKSVTIYTIVDGKVARLDILDDPAASRAQGELTAVGSLRAPT
jgi:ketosteroid isomerase-like protein